MSTSSSASSERPRLYGRRKGRQLRSNAQGLIEDLLPRLTLNLDGPFARGPRPLWLEIGFGKGEHLAAQAKANRHVDFIGCEPFINGVAGLLDLIDRAGLDNIRIHPDDARTLLARLPAAALARVFILHPDP